MADIFNKVISGINNGVNSVSENSRIFMEKNRLNSAIKEKNEQKIRAAQNIGMAVYDMIKCGQLACSDFDDLCKVIDTCNEEIAALNEQLASLQVQRPADTYSQVSVKCTCGHVNKPGATFCTECGTKLEN